MAGSTPQGVLPGGTSGDRMQLYDVAIGVLDAQQLVVARHLQNGATQLGNRFTDSATVEGIHLDTKQRDFRLLPVFIARLFKVDTRLGSGEFEVGTRTVGRVGRLTVKHAIP